MKLTEATWVTKETEVDLLNIPGRDWPEEIKQIAYQILSQPTLGSEIKNLICNGNPYEAKRLLVKEIERRYKLTKDFEEEFKRDFNI